ncbi:MAG TPA: hypothetical protein VI298_13240 [Geobacteraceae bacterium]
MSIEKILVSDYMKRTLTDLVEDIQASNKSTIFGEMRFKDFIEVADSPHGVYVFFDSHGKPEYIGKASSQIFLGRLAVHCDTRLDNWMSHFANKVLKSSGQPRTPQNYISALKRVLDCSILLICFEDNIGKQNTKNIARLEKALRSTLKPSLNDCSQVEDMSIAISALLCF